MQRTPRLALFDLDGTLIDSQVGILASIRHAFVAVGAQPPDQATMLSWIGPPFHQTFPSVLGADAQRTDAAIAKYRERYLERGWAEHTIYAGIANVIEELAASDCKLAVVTTKPPPQSTRIVASLPFGNEFARIYAPAPEARHSTKAEMIAAALRDFDVDAAHTAMIGDRYFDIEGARANHVYAIGVTWGFGSADELRKAGADALAESPAQLTTLLRSA